MGQSSACVARFEPGEGRGEGNAVRHLATTPFARLRACHTKTNQRSKVLVDRMNDNDMYEGRIRDHYEQPFHRGPCPQVTHAHEDDNPMCGDMVRVELHVGDDGRIQDAYFTADCCKVSLAAASMLIEKINGKSLDEVKHFSAPDMLALYGARLTPNRQKCCLLCWRVLQSAIYAPLSK